VLLGRKLDADGKRRFPTSKWEGVIKARVQVRWIRRQPSFSRVCAVLRISRSSHLRIRRKAAMLTKAVLMGDAEAFSLQNL
jgi:hypothetical protein